MDQTLILLLLIVAVWVLAVMIGLPLAAVWQGRRINRLAARVRQLEEASTQVGTPAQRLPSLPPAWTPGQPKNPSKRPSSSKRPLRNRPRGPWYPAKFRQQRPRGFEAWIGRRAMGWAAVVLLLFATAFFLKHAFENQWIGEVGRVALGISAGVGLCTAGYRYQRRAWRVLGQMCAAAGIVLLYLATFAAFGYYHLLPQGMPRSFSSSWLPRRQPWQSCMRPRPLP